MFHASSVLASGGLSVRCYKGMRGGNLMVGGSSFGVFPEMLGAW